MTLASISLSEAKAKLSALVNEVAYGHKHYVILSHGRAKARLVPLEDPDTQAKPRDFLRTLRAARRFVDKLRRRGLQVDAVRDLEDLRSGKVR